MKPAGHQAKVARCQPGVGSGWSARMCRLLSNHNYILYIMWGPIRFKTLPQYTVQKQKKNRKKKQGCVDLVATREPFEILRPSRCLSWKPLAEHFSSPSRLSRPRSDPQWNGFGFGFGVNLETFSVETFFQLHHLLSTEQSPVEGCEVKYQK